MSERVTPQVVPFDDGKVTTFPPALIDHRAVSSGPISLGADFMTFESEGQTDWWTVQYEEMIYVVAGTFWVLVKHDDFEERLQTVEGDVVSIPKGSTVRYGGSRGARVFIAITPANWRELNDADASSAN